MTINKRGVAAHETLLEPLLTIPQAAKQLGLPVYAVRRAAKAGLIPTHRPFSSRVRVLLSEVRIAITEQDEGVAK